MTQVIKGGLGEIIVFPQSISIQGVQMKNYNFHLPSLLEDDTLSVSEVSEKIFIMRKRKELEKKYSSLIKERKDGKQYYIYIKRKQYTSTTYDGLISILYNMNYGREQSSLSDLFPEWMIWRRDNCMVSNKTLKENLFLWNAYYKDTDIVSKPLNTLVAKDFISLFRKMTMNGVITVKRFNDAKSVLNGIYYYAIEEEIVQHNPIKEINYRQFNFKPVNIQNDVFTLKERRLILDYLHDDEDIYSLAIQLDFHLTVRIGELKSLKWTDITGKGIRIQGQLLDTQTMNDDLSFNPCTHENVNHVKGNTEHGFRTIPLTSGALEVLERIKKVSGNNEYIFMQDEHRLSTCTFNRHLKRCCNALGIENRSSHKIRFTVASLLYKNGVPATTLQKMLGHSTLAMTLHYLKDVSVNDDTYIQMSAVLD